MQESKQEVIKIASLRENLARVIQSECSLLPLIIVEIKYEWLVQFVSEGDKVS